MKQKGLAPVYLLVSLIILIGILLTPMPYYQGQIVCDPPCPSKNAVCPPCPKPGWYFGDPLYKKVFNYFYSINNPPNQGEALITITPPTPQTTLTPSPTPDATTNWKTEQANISKDYSFNLITLSDYFFNISVPLKYSIAVDPKAKDTLRIYDEKKTQVISIFNYAGGENSPSGKMIIDGVAFTIDYGPEIKCLSDIYPTNWQPGTQSLMSIHVDCNVATPEQIQKYTKIIQSIRFNPSLKKILQ